MCGVRFDVLCMNVSSFYMTEQCSCYYLKKKNQSELQASKLARTEHRASPATKRRRRSGEAEHAADETRPARDTLVLVVRLGEANQIPVTRAFGSTSPPWGQELGHRRRDPRHATTEAAAAVRGHEVKASMHHCAVSCRR